MTLPRGGNAKLESIHAQLGRLLECLQLQFEEEACAELLLSMRRRDANASNLDDCSRAVHRERRCDCCDDRATRCVQTAFCRDREHDMIVAVPHGVQWAGTGRSFEEDFQVLLRLVNRYGAVLVLCRIERARQLRQTIAQREGCAEFTHFPAGASRVW